MANKKNHRQTGVANPRYAREMHGLRSSNAAGAHQDRRTRRARSRGSALRMAISRDGN